MLFSSLEFIFRFLPCFLFLYYVTPKKMRNLVLLAGSIFFYAFGEMKYVPLILASALVNWLVAQKIDRSKEKGASGTGWLIAGLSYHFGWLFFFKYTNLFLSVLSICSRGRIRLPQVTATLPLGISFFTFTSAAYLADVYRRKIPAERDVLRFGTYFLMFPQLLSGPIVRYPDLSAQLSERRYGSNRFESGLKIFTIGLGYKVILANQLSSLWNSIQTIGFESISTPLAWLGVVSFSLQIYFDFNGYSLMAIGIGEMLGFTLPVNFAHPYMARSVGEFWRRWHITLGTWFRDYVYIPLGGNRKGKLRQIINLLIVWLLTGLWHGAGANFLVWGLYLFVFLAIEKLVLQPILMKHKIVSRCYLLFVIGLSWILFAVTDFRELGIYFSRLFPVLLGGRGIAVNHADIMKQMKLYGGLILLGIFFSTPVPMRWYIKHKNQGICIAFLLLVFWYAVYLLALGDNNPFLYFRF